jgi:hypothetical protein
MGWRWKIESILYQGLVSSQTLFSSVFPFSTSISSPSIQYFKKVDATPHPSHHFYHRNKSSPSLFTSPPLYLRADNLKAITVHNGTSDILSVQSEGGEDFGTLPVTLCKRDSPNHLPP